MQKMHLTLGMLLLAACSKSNAPEEPDAPPPDSLPTDAEATAAEVRSLGAEGGELELGGLRLTIPPDALSERVMISVEELAADAIPDGYRGASALYRFGPDGLRFERPVTVRIPITQDDEGLALFWSNDEGGFDRVEGARRDGLAMEAEVEHFSFGFVGSVAEADPQDQSLCSRGGRCDQLRHTTVNKLDLLFMVDNSGSMREEQVLLSEQFPRMIRAFVTGDIDGDGSADVPPVEDLHVGVVSSDMGLQGIMGIPGCEGAGDDGVLQQGSGDCSAELPAFLAFAAGDDPEQAATEFGCMAMLGTEGCGFEQQLESVLKAVWPAGDDRVTFLGDLNGEGTQGHGGEGDNGGFLRNDPEDPSLLGVVVVTDEEDCSSADTRHFTPDIYLDPADPLFEQDLNLRCFYNPQNLYALERYVNGLKALRPDNENLVVFAAIAGVPPELVDEAALADYDFGDDADRERFYDELLAAEAMQEQIDPNRTPEQGGNLVPSCVTERGRAYPPRRIVQAARGFGANGVVQSICQDDFAPAIDPILQRLAARIGGACIDGEHPRDADGRVACDVLWRLRAGGSCDDADFLQPAPGGLEDVCVVEQLAVGAGAGVPAGEGWYLDDFSPRAALCPGQQDAAVVFTADAQVPTGVESFLDCEP